MDKIAVDVDTDQRLCVSCGFTEERPGEPANRPVEPPSRVNRAIARRMETRAEAVTLVDPSTDGKEPGR